MSTKTLRKRIALVAVAALGAGVLVTSPASAANNTAPGSTSNGDTATAILNVATVPSITGAAIISSTAEASTSANNKSLGLLANSTTLTTSSLTSTATMRSDGELAFYTKASATSEIGTTIVVEGGTISQTTISDTDGSSGTPATNINASKTVAAFGQDAGADNIIAFAVKPTTGSTSITVSMYHSAALATASDTAMATALAGIQAGTTSSGTLKQRYVVTVATTSASGAYSAANSFIRGVLVGTVGQAESTNVDEAGSLTVDNSASSAAFININLKDAYKVSLDTVGALTIEATNGAGIKYSASGTASTTGFNLIAVDTDTSGTLTVVRPLAFLNKGFTTTVTVKWNGVSVGTKTVKFLGEVAKIVASADAYNLQAGATSAGSMGVTYVDNAGNVLLPQSGTSVVSTTLNQYVSNATYAAAANSLPTVDDPTAYMDVTCLGTASTGRDAGSASLVFQHVNAFSGSVVKSDPVKVTCSGNTATYTAALDKAVYAPGDIATLTITGKDAQGNLAQGNVNTIQSTVAGREFTITASQMTPVTAISTTSVLLSTGPGVKTYKFVVGITEGSYSAVVAAPNVNRDLLGGTNQTIAYKIAANSTAVSMADVLKAIVSLIASINKQIAALQKALLKK